MNWELYLDKISNRYIGGYADTGQDISSQMDFYWWIIRNKHEFLICL